MTARSAHGTGTRGTKRTSGAPQPSVEASSSGRLGASTTRSGGAMSPREGSREGGRRRGDPGVRYDGAVPRHRFLFRGDRRAGAEEGLARLGVGGSGGRGRRPPRLVPPPGVVVGRVKRVLLHHNTGRRGCFPGGAPLARERGST